MFVQGMNVHLAIDSFTQIGSMTEHDLKSDLKGIAILRDRGAVSLGPDYSEQPHLSTSQNYIHKPRPQNANPKIPR